MHDVKLTGEIHIAADGQQLFDDLGGVLLASAKRAVQSRGVFHLALSGGGTPKPFYEMLAKDAKYSGLPWAQTHLWIVDERCVAEDDERSNIKMIRAALTDHVPIPDASVHPMPVLADDPAMEYEQTISDSFGGMPLMQFPRLDFVLLGMGGDAHTASLFPQSPAIKVTDRWIATNDGERVVPPPRVTMTYPLLNHARELVVLLLGAGKYETLQRIEARLAEAGPDIQELPITGIDPSVNGGSLTWYLDQAAASGS